jgi:predicted DNA-binding protein (MmcQ/YjbR family)
MNIEELRDYCLQKPAAAEGLPFGEDTLVLKLAENCFCLPASKMGVVLT